MGRDRYKLFSQGTIAGLTLKNRLVRSATYESCMTKDSRVTQKMLDLYQKLSRGGVGMIISGHMAVMQQGKGMPKQMCISDDSYIDDIAKVAETVHRAGNGCKIIGQLSHTGRQVLHENREAECVGPSDVPSPILKKSPRTLSTSEIEHIVKCFVDAAVRVKKAGFDGVQFHAAHGWLLSSFLSPYTNRRQDRYGGSLQNRLNILREIISGARAQVGAFPLLIKVNGDDFVQGGITLHDFPELAGEIADLGVDAIEVSGGMWDCLARTEEELGFFPLPIPEARTRIDSADKQSYFLNYAEKLDLAIPVILVGGNRDVEDLEAVMAKGAVDFFSLSRPLISEPDLPNRWLEGRGSSKADCVSCNACLLTVKFGSLHCMLKQSRMQQKVVHKLTPYIWKMFLK
ncbi:MAG: NADH:flavin oxidoreductase [Desulfobacterota bacterium]|nr:NADH:flavin oxidoreductase [Thermodesulfobacteriota bacterium]